MTNRDHFTLCLLVQKQQQVATHSLNKWAIEPNHSLLIMRTHTDTKLCRLPEIIQFNCSGIATESGSLWSGAVMHWHPLHSIRGDASSSLTSVMGFIRMSI